MNKTLDDHLDALHVRGFTVIEGIMTTAQIDAARAALEETFRREARIGPRRGWHNEAYKVAYMLPAKHPLFRSFYQNDALLQLMRAALGSRCVLSSLNGLTMIPGGGGQSLHIDQRETVPGVLVCINALHTLDDFTRENGSTRLVPGSQHRTWTNDAATLAAAEAEAIYMEAPAGSLIAYSGGLWHAGSRNQTTRDRRAIHAFFARDWVRPEWDFPRSLSHRVVTSLTEEQRQLFGFSAGPNRYDRRSNRVLPSSSFARWLPLLHRLRTSMRGRRQ
jgi:ectoine hydroxylase-related dioxygenase (phytanoyl-CoA dioxygenase family)